MRGRKYFFKREAEQTTSVELDLDVGQAHIRKEPLLFEEMAFISLSVKIKRTLKTVDGCFYSSELTINSGLAWPLRVVSTDRQTQTIRPGCRPCVCVSGCTPASAGAILIQDWKHWIIQHKLKLLGCLVLSGSNLFEGK